MKMSTLFTVHSKWRNMGSLLYLPHTIFSPYTNHFVLEEAIHPFMLLKCPESASTCLNQCVALDIILLFIIFKETMESLSRLQINFIMFVPCIIDNHFITSVKKMCNVLT